MIYSLNGKLILTNQSFIVIECGGVGFKCFVSFNTLQKLPKTGENVNVFTYMSVREDAMDLYAFSTTQELDAFKLLITVSGIGPKAAISILSELSPNALSLAIASGDSKSITKAQGVGAKTAQRVVLELKDKITSVATPEVSQSISNVSSISNGSNHSEAIEALVALGFSQSDAAMVLSSVDPSTSVDDMIRIGLKQLSNNL